MNYQLDNQTALVTGASRGIGKAIAARLGRAGAWVVGTSTTTEGAAGITEHFQANGIAGRGLVLDISAEASVAQLEATLKEAAIIPSILVNNAGITRDNLMLRMKQQEWDDVINTNLNAVYRLSKLCLRNMIKARYGRIINITSVVALSGNPGQTNYVAAKAGIIGFTRALAQETGSRGITVNCVAPGFIDTDMTASLTEAQREKLLEQIPLRRLGLAEDVADAVEFIASQSAGYITGEVLNVNGGMYMA
ncbi:MAG: 3-oxoacyl-ACP reductase FabG [Gammaproteobacteria bacterium]|nr:3-oxoacyl-ACP reductase FabG [Gammaproteobacteria bacterium]MCY4282080.1 3-oxoacyl-ACP reductase FabG [Gammaproteobacteria bacterium]MCY4337510.1 3-oxoacyl-ACP reductase FabG [Gammaproteobacteria bacterium]